MKVGPQAPSFKACTLHFNKQTLNLAEKFHFASASSAILTTVCCVSLRFEGESSSKAPSSTLDSRLQWRSSAPQPQKAAEARHRNDWITEQVQVPC